MRDGDKEGRVKNVPPEIAFQNHIREELLRRFKGKALSYTALEQDEITDTENFIAENVLWAFVTASQPDEVARVADTYGDDTRDEFFKALRSELCRKPMWMILRDGLEVRGVTFMLYFAHPRSEQSATWDAYRQNRFSFRHHFYFGETNKEIDFVFFLNGLPIVALELKHEANQTVSDAVDQYVNRDHSKKIFKHPFAYIAADTTQVMLATDPSKSENFRWHNQGLVNEAASEDEYPVEFLYDEVLAPENLLEDIAFFLVRVPEKPAKDGDPARPPFTIYPRFHQSRCVKNIAADIQAHFAEQGDIGRKYLANHAPGSGKTLTICWLASKLDGLYKPGTNEKLVETVFIVTAAKSLDKNIKDDIAKFVHLKDRVGLSARSEDVDDFLHGNLDRKVAPKAIIVTTQQKLAYILDKLREDESLRKRRVAFLIDEAHRDQDGKRAADMRRPFRDVEEDADDEKENAEIIRAKAGNQMFVAFTATPAQATVDVFGSPFDTYTEAEAIQEGYIVDVASSIVSYTTLYNLHCSYVPKDGDETEFPKGLVAKALKTIAYGDYGIVQYKAEVMLRYFDEEVSALIDGRAKAMIVAPSRPTGLLYYQILKEKMAQRKEPYKLLYAFADFTHPETNEVISEHQLNGLAEGEKIEDRFDTDEYRIMIVANKFQTGFNQPLLAGMFIDKPIVDRNAVQTVSRLNRTCPGKDRVVVVDFTNNADAILRAFARYRQGSPFAPDPPDPERAKALYQDILAAGVFALDEVKQFAAFVKGGATDAQIQYRIQGLRQLFLTRVPGFAERKAYVRLLARYVKQIEFFMKDYDFGADMMDLYVFASIAGRQLIKQGTMSELMQAMRHTQVTKASVQFQGVRSGGGVVVRPSRRTGHGPGVPPVTITVQGMIDEIRQRFQITDEEALFIKQVTEQKIQDPDVHDIVERNKDDVDFLFGSYRHQVHIQISDVYQENGRFEETADPKYTDEGAIFDSMATVVINTVKAA